METANIAILCILWLNIYGVYLVVVRNRSEHTYHSTLMNNCKSTTNLKRLRFFGIKCM